MSEAKHKDFRVVPTPKRTDITTLQGHRALGHRVVAGLAVREKFGEEAVLGRPIACKKKLRRNPNTSSESDHPSTPKAKRKEWSHNLHVSPATVHHTEAFFSTVRGIYGREHDDLMDDLDVNVAIWGIFLNAALRAAVHLGQDCEPTLCSEWEKWEMILFQPGRAKLNGIRKNNHFKDMNRTDGMPTEFEWKKIPRNHIVGPPREDVKSDERPTV